MDAQNHGKDLTPGWLIEGSVNLDGSFPNSVAFEQIYVLVNEGLMAAMRRSRESTGSTHKSHTASGR
jgi:hypothetical protein